MGYPMAGHLAKAGHVVRVFNRTHARAESWCETFSAETPPANTPAEAAEGADLIMTCVGDDDDLKSVTLGSDGAIYGMKTGSILVDHTTASAKIARELAHTLSEKTLGFIDAPVSGGEQGAINGQLTIMCGGEPGTFAQAKDVLNCYARQVTLMGPPGNGQLTKMVNQICIAGLIQSLAEGVDFAINAGLDPYQVFDVISKGAAQSWQMVNRHKTMVEDNYDHGFAVDWMRKDLAICLDEARRNGSNLPIAALVDQFYSEVQQMNGSRWDTSSLLKRLQKNRKQ